MRISLTRRRRVAIAAGLAALALAAGLPALASAAPAAPRGEVVVSCTGRARVRPHSFVLTCADGNDYLAGLHWVSWRAGAAFGRGTEHVSTCVPDCARGHVRAYPVLVTLWRAVPRPRHARQAYLSRLTEIYTGPRPAYYRGGRKYHPRTVTWQLVAASG